MIIGIPKEIKNNENRVGMTPAGVFELCKRGHKVFVQHTAGWVADSVIMNTSQQVQ
ncbi:alanine dehydrogenase [Bacteroides graminisolvens DSM 19988 = JCM 15093]|uniref:Alanine dehydrogenase n=1 Tax=Bacteroides graminisolvens DSM 19988 = JCM 15093 TaxID=1121097 RepID=A0A069D1B4_9BACE|nr:alanine dehydrogenase [Bacteroides graminisolvens DSM 19988 = JCM 15093]